MIVSAFAMAWFSVTSAPSGNGVVQDPIMPMRPAGAGTLSFIGACARTLVAPPVCGISCAQAHECGMPVVTQVAQHQQGMGTARHFGPEGLTCHGHKKRHQRSGQHHEFTPAKNGSGQGEALAPRHCRCRSGNPRAHAGGRAFHVWQGFAGIDGGGSGNPLRRRAVSAAAPLAHAALKFTPAPFADDCVESFHHKPPGAGTLFQGDAA